MPEFLDEFAASVIRKKEGMKEKVLKGTPNPLRDHFREKFPSFWVGIDDLTKLGVNPAELSVMAVDSSVYSNLLSTGGVFYVVRSLAVCRSVEQKLLESDVFFSKGGSVTERDFISVKMEMLEFQVAIDALKGGLGCGTILIDGSLYGRLVHVPLESKVEDERLVLIDYFRVYRELLDLCRKSNVLLVGVAKESRSTAFRDFLLRLVFYEELAKLDIDDDDARKLKPLFMEVVNDFTLGLQKFERFGQKYGVKLETIRMILLELARSRPDYQLVMNFAGSVGYTKPLLLGSPPRLQRKLEALRSDAKGYVRKNFPNALREKGKGFVDDAAQVIAGIPDFPAIVSFYVLFDRRDSPIRIDVPCWDQKLVDVGWHKPASVDLEVVLKVLATGYCGLDCHNLWLKNVDERVRLKKKTVDNIYVPYMEKLFGEKIIRGRSYRRVRFP
ncbi:DNA double-strand break repair nuclease NurA [Candidatus Bathyarchaeota archaeon]|nr:DNA double-strand break repair nuclease NurA [Candidatus Bathyarchaeota archaeon]